MFKIKFMRPRDGGRAIRKRLCAHQRQPQFINAWAELSGNKKGSKRANSSSKFLEVAGTQFPSGR